MLRSVGRKFNGAGCATDREAEHRDKIAASSESGCGATPGGMEGSRLARGVFPLHNEEVQLDPSLVHS